MKQLFIRLHSIQIKKYEYDLVKFDVVYHLNIECGFCSWEIPKVRSDFLRLNAKLPKKFHGNFNSVFPIWGIRPSDTKLVKHEVLVAEYIDFLNSITSCPYIEKFTLFKKHDVLANTLEFVKELRGNTDTNVEIWDMLNSCSEDLILTEKQLHSINSCHSLPDFQIPFMDLRRTLENVENLKILSNERDDSHKYKPAPNLDMSSFQSLTSLTLQDIDFKGVTELGNLGHTLHQMTIKAEIEEISDILIWIDEENDRSPVAWNSLEVLNLANNRIEFMDESLQLLIQLTELNLSKNKIEIIDNIQGLPYLRMLDLSHNKIKDAPSLHLRLGNITRLNLAHNQVQILQGFERLFSLEDLDLSYNNIKQMNEVSRLRGLPQLEALSLEGNPIASDSSYRCDVLSQLNWESVELDKEPLSAAEIKKLEKMKGQEREIDVRTEESICYVDIADSTDYDDLCDEAIVFSEVNLCETPVLSDTRQRSATLVPIIEDYSGESSESASPQEKISTVLDVEKMISTDGDNWLNSFMDMADVIPKPRATEILQVTEETLKKLNSSQPKPRKVKKTLDGTESQTTDTSSVESRDYKLDAKSCEGLKSVPKTETVPFHIVPNEVYNIDEKIDDLVCRYSNLAFEELQRTFSVYKDGEFLVVALLPNSKPFKPELAEIKPRGGLITWSVLPHEIESCCLVGDQVYIKKYGDVIPVIYSQLFLHDTAHLYLLVTKMKDIREPRPSEEMSKLASDRVFLTVAESETDHLVTFPCHCFRYCRSDIPLPVVIAIQDSEVLVIEVDNFDLLTINQDMLVQILADESFQCSILFREKISNIRQIFRSFLAHTARIEFKEDTNPFGSPRTTFSLLGFNNSDMETFIESVAVRLDNCEIPPSSVIVTEQEPDMRVLKRVIRVQELEQVKCISIRLESLFFRSLIMTEQFLFIVEEDFTRWPPPCFVRHPPLTPRYSIVAQIRIRLLFGITLFTEIFRGSYALSLNYYINLKTFERGRNDVFISSYENREQVIGHIKRIWRNHYNKDIIISTMKRYESPAKTETVTSLAHGKDFNVENFTNIAMDKIHRFSAEVLGDSYNILYLTKTHCLHSATPDQELRCAVLVTEENIHVLSNLPPPIVPMKLMPQEDLENRVSDHLALVLSWPVTDICQIVCGIFEQKIRFEFGYGSHGLITFMTRDVNESRELQRAVIEALHCQYQTDSYESDDVLITRKGRELSIVHLDEDRLDELRFTVAKHAGITDYNDIQIVNYSLLYQEVLGKKSLITCVITNTTLYLIREDNIFWPLPQSNQHRIPNSLQFKVVETIPLDDIMCINFTHFTSCDLVILFENTDLHSGFRDSAVKQEQFCLIDGVEALGKTASLHTTTLQQRDHIIRIITQLTPDKIPVKKLGT